MAITVPGSEKEFDSLDLVSLLFFDRFKSFLQQLFALLSFRVSLLECGGQAITELLDDLFMMIFTNLVVFMDLVENRLQALHQAG